MKKTLGLLLILTMGSAFPYTLGETYNNVPESNIQVNRNQANNLVYVQTINNTKFQITTNNKNQITRIDYSGQTPLDLKDSLGQYYESYIQAWKNRPNKGNHSYSIVDTNNVHVETYGLGTKLYYNTLQLK